MPDYSDLKDVLVMLSEAQEPETDMRERVREVIHFLEDDNGQWEPGVIQNMNGRPRYQFDKCNPVVDSIAGELEQAEFAIKVRPANGDADDDIAKIYDGMIRNIQAMSDADYVYGAAGRSMVAAGFDAWRIVHDYGDTDSFDQDLFIRKIANAVDRVWFDHNAERQDMSDANHCFVLQSMTKAAYQERFPKGSGKSISDARTAEVYSYKKEEIVIGEILYKSPITKELVLMSNNKVYEVNDDYKSVIDELQAEGVTEVRRRKKKSYIVKSRLFDGSDWLTDDKETVFTYIPIIPVYANFQIVEGKVIYRGAVNKLMDPQRVLNYAQSRAIEEGALSPRGKYWMTREQAEKDVATLQTLNTNANPIQTYTHVDNQPPPFWQGGAQINQGLMQTAADMSQNIIEASGVFSANQGNSPDQSGYAIELQQQKGDNSTIKYFRSQELAITHTARVLVDAIPKVYDTKRMVRILGEDGTSRIETINDDVFDQDQGKMVTLRDIRIGKYDVVCDVGPAFRSRQQETARAFLEAAGVDPTLIETGGDIWLKNLNAPGFDQMAERKRLKLLKAGEIPDTQMTDEEKEIIQKMIAQMEAEMAAEGPDPLQQAIMEQTQANTADIISKAQERTDKAILAARKQDMEEFKAAQQADRDSMRLMIEQQKFIVDSLNTQAMTLKALREAMGVDAIVGQGAIEAYSEQVEEVKEAQDES